MKKLLFIAVLLFSFNANSAYLKQANIVEFTSLSSLPQDATNILLECNKYYYWLGTAQEITTKSIVFPAGCDSGLIGQSILDAPLVYVGSGTFLKSPATSDDLNGAVTDNGDGTVRLTSSTAHEFAEGSTILLSNTTNYNGFYKVEKTPTGTTFDITETYISETLSSAVAVGDTKSIRLQNITFAAPSGTLFDITGLDRIGTFVRPHDVIVSNVANLGKLDTISFLGDNLQFDDFGQGLVGENVRFTLENLSFSNPKNVTKDTSCTFENVGNTVDATEHWMYDNDIVRLKTGGTLPVDLSSGFSDLNGTVDDNGDGTVLFKTTAVHGLSIGDTVIPRGTTNYDNTYIVQAVPTTTTFDVIAPFVAETFVNNTAQLGYYVVNATTDDFQLSRTEGGSVETFTDNGTGNHEFFENSIGITMRGSLYSFTYEEAVYSGTGKNFTAWDFEPTVSGILSRGSMISVGFDTAERFNQFTGSSFDQTYRYHAFTGVKLGFDSKNTGVIYITGNTDDTEITLQNTIYEVTEGTSDTYNLERAFQSSNRLCYDAPSPSAVKVFAVATLTKSGTTQAYRLHILKNGEDATVSEPVVDVINSRQVAVSDFEEISVVGGDCLSLGVENLDGIDNITFTTYKLGW